MNTHQLKSWPQYFAPIADGSKPFDMRVDDRGYQVGDHIIFEEFRNGVGEYTGRISERRISYILRDAQQFGLITGFCVLGLVRIDGEG
jgi:hypothetical protein